MRYRKMIVVVAFLMLQINAFDLHKFVSVVWGRGISGLFALFSCLHLLLVQRVLTDRKSVV